MFPDFINVHAFEHSLLLLRTMNSNSLSLGIDAKLISQNPLCSKHIQLLLPHYCLLANLDAVVFRD